MTSLTNALAHFLMFHFNRAKAQSRLSLNIASGGDG